jgi:SAM-dependent methyltransferase
MELKKDQWLVSYPDDGNAVCFEMEDTSFWYQHRNQCILNAIQYGGFDRDFHDIGGGNGITASILQQNGYQVTLVEPYAEGIGNAQKRGIRRTIQSTLENFQPEEPTPGVGFFDVMEHMEDDEDFLRHIHRIVKPGGKIILSVPAFQDLWSDNDVQLGHFRRYKLKQIDQLLVRSGFRPIYGTYFFSLVWLPMWLLRVLPNRFGVQRKNTPKKKRSEHMATSPYLSKMLRRMLSWEIKMIRRGWKIPFGTSCLVIAQKE